MYFAILGKHPQISLAELEQVEPVFHPSTKKGIVLFDTSCEEKLKNLGGCIKIGKVVAEKELQTILQDTKIIGIQEEAIGKHFKRTIGIRRFKTVKINHTDKEIKEKGKEIINLDDGKYGVVERYQDIPLYEAIDFEKPGRSMSMGMMPAKLAHILINLAISHHPQEITIYDPFCGSGTTNFLANAMGYNTIGSDINISYAQKNLPWRQSTRFYQKDLAIDFFEQDITKPISSKIIPGKKYCIVTEGWLGPIITKKSNFDEIHRAQQQIQKLYTSFFQSILESDLFSTIICTIPRYIGHTNDHIAFFEKIIQKSGYQRKEINEVYQREDQQIGRKICIISK